MTARPNGRTAFGAIHPINFLVLPCRPRITRSRSSSNIPTKLTSRQIRHAKRECQHNLNKAISADKVTLRHDVREYLDDTTSSEDEAEPTSLPVSSTPTSPTTASPEMDSEDPYEYDTTGHAILSDAVNKAVEKYETRKAEKIVKEYEMVPRESEASVGGYMSDGFEVVEIV